MTNSEGTTEYKYDKYNRLRFTKHKDAEIYEQRGITFTKYDQFGRVLVTGTLPSNYGWDALEADKDYSVTQNLPHFENYIPSSTNADTANFVTVNMYDKYLKSGIFASMSDPFSWLPADANSSRNVKGKLVLTAFRDKPGQGWNYRIYLYDALGKVNYIYQKFGTALWKLIFKETDALGNQKRENLYRVEGGLVLEHATWNNYDKQGRLWDVRTDPAGSYGSAKVEATYTYNKADQCSTLTYDQVTNANKTTTYTYSTTRGWLNTIVNGNNNFYENLLYYNNGNIQNQTITNSALGGTQTLTYNYDAMNRLNSVMNGSSTVEAFWYDADGNISKRNYLSGGYLYTARYGYSGSNKLYSLLTDDDDFYFDYDYKGNVTSDPYTGITNISYDNRNLPLIITTSTSTTYKYRYDDGGNRIFKDAKGNKEYYIRDDLGHEFAVYDVATDRLKMINLYGSDLMGRIDVIWTSRYDEEREDYIYTRSDRRYFYVKDHLGSIRQTLDESGNLQSATDYYAFGGIKSSIVGGIMDKYKFTGKERDLETGLDYFGARYYNPFFGRWMSVDPLDDLNPGISPYAYCHNDPINRIDPDGMDDEEPLNGRTLPTVVVTAKRQPQDLKQVTWFQMSIGLANDLVYLNRANQYEVWYGVPYLKINPNQNSNTVLGIVPLCIDGIKSGTIKASDIVMTVHAEGRASTRGFTASRIANVMNEGEATIASGRFGQQVKYTLGNNTVVQALDGSNKGKIITTFSNKTVNGIKGHWVE